MSTVRMSDYLKLEIVNKYKEAHIKAHPIQVVDPSYGDKLYNKYLSTAIDILKEKIEELFGDNVDASTLFLKASELQVEGPVNVYTTDWDVDDNNKWTVEATLQENYRFTIPLSTERLVPMSVQISSWGSKSVEEASWKWSRYEDPIVDYVCKVIEYNSELGARRKTEEENVKALLDKFTTLNQALKAWPALSKLVAPEKLAKVHERQQRKRKQDLQKEMADEVVIDNDLNKTILTSALIGDTSDE